MLPSPVAKLLLSVACSSTLKSVVATGDGVVVGVVGRQSSAEGNDDGGSPIVAAILLYVWGSTVNVAAAVVGVVAVAVAVVSRGGSSSRQSEGWSNDGSNESHEE